jgi:hypothetical protein
MVKYQYKLVHPPPSTGVVFVLMYKCVSVFPAGNVFIVMHSVFALLSTIASTLVLPGDLCLHLCIPLDCFVVCS